MDVVPLLGIGCDSITAHELIHENLQCKELAIHFDLENMSVDSLADLVYEFDVWRALGIVWLESRSLAVGDRLQAGHRCG